MTTKGNINKYSGRVSKGPFNIRVFLFCAIFVIACILSCTMLFVNPIIGYLLLFAVIVFPIGLALYYYRIGESKKMLCYVLIGICVIVVGIGYFGRIILWQGSSIKGDYRVAGTISVVNNLYDSGFRSIVLEDIYLNGQSINGKMRVNISIKDEDTTSLYYAQKGDELRFDGFVTSYDLLNEESGFDLGRLTYGIQYFSRVVDNLAFVYLIPKATSGMDLVRLELGELLDKHLSQDTAGVARAMLIGDTTALNADGYNIFSQSGFAHVLAVSGMHISFIATLLGFILKKITSRRLLSFLIVLSIVLFYAWLSAFSPSVLRAVIMFVVAGICKLRGKWYDGLNSLGFAACVLLLFDPFLLFSTSFLLSFGSVLGINLFYKSINRWLQTIIDKKLTFNTSEFSKKSNIIPKYTTRTIKNTASGLAMGLSVQATTVALTALLLHRIATYSIVANLVLKPLLGIVFIGLMLLVPIVYIVPFMGWALQLFDIVLVALLSLLNWIADLPYSNIFIWPGLPFVLALMIGLVSCSRFVLYRRTRLVSGVVSVLLYLSIFVVGLPQNKLNNVIVPMSNNQTIVISNNETMYFGNIGAKASESYGVLNFKISKIHTLFVTDIFVNASSLRAMRRSFGIEEFFVPPTISINDILSMEKAGLNFSIMDEQVMTDHGQFSIGCIMLDNVFMGYQLLGGNVNILISAQDMPLYKFDEDILHNFDILRGANTVAYNDALQIVDYSFFDVYTDNVLVAYDRQRAYFDFVEWVIRE